MCVLLLPFTTVRARPRDCTQHRITFQLTDATHSIGVSREITQETHNLAGSAALNLFTLFADFALKPDGELNHVRVGNAENSF